MAVVAFALVYGFTFLVTAPLTVVFAGAIFGRGRLGLVAGSISMIHQISGGLGALTGALIFDLWGSYDRAFLLLLAISVAAVPVTLMLRERPLALLGSSETATPPVDVVGMPGYEIGLLGHLESHHDSQ